MTVILGRGNGSALLAFISAPVYYMTPTILEWNRKGNDTKSVASGRDRVIRN